MFVGLWQLQCDKRKNTKLSLPGPIFFRKPRNLS